MTLRSGSCRRLARLLAPASLLVAACDLTPVPPPGDTPRGPQPPAAGPRVEILFPPDSCRLDGDRPPPAWRCRVTAAGSPGDSMAPPGAPVRWCLDGDTLAAAGLHIPPPAMASGRHQLIACARDASGAGGADTCSFEVWRYPPGETPEEGLAVFCLALRAADPARARDALDRRFRAAAGSAAHGPCWDRHREMLALAALLHDPDCRRFVWRFLHPPAERFSLRGEAWAKIELTRFELERPTDAGSMQRSRARIFLRGGSEDGIWRLVCWWDLHAACGAGARGPSWSEIKRVALSGGQPAQRRAASSHRALQGEPT